MPAPNSFILNTLGVLVSLITTFLAGRFVYVKLFT